MTTRRTASTPGATGTVGTAVGRPWDYQGQNLGDWWNAHYGTARHGWEQNDSGGWQHSTSPWYTDPRLAWALMLAPGAYGAVSAMGAGGETAADAAASGAGTTGSTVPVAGSLAPGLTSPGVSAATGGGTAATIGRTLMGAATGPAIMGISSLISSLAQPRPNAFPQTQQSADDFRNMFNSEHNTLEAQRASGIHLPDAVFRSSPTYSGGVLPFDIGNNNPGVGPSSIPGVGDSGMQAPPAVDPSSLPNLPGLATGGQAVPRNPGAPGGTAVSRRPTGGPPAFTSPPASPGSDPSSAASGMTLLQMLMNQTRQQ